MQYPQTRYLRSVLLVLLGVIIIFSSKAFSGNQESTLTPICSSNNLLCNTIIKAWQPLENFWNNISAAQQFEGLLLRANLQLKESHPIYADYSEKYVTIFAILLGFVIGIIGIVIFFRSLRISVRGIKESKKRKRHKHEKALRRYFAYYRRPRFWPVLSLFVVAGITVFIATTSDGNHSVASFRVCSSLNWLCENIDSLWQAADKTSIQLMSQESIDMFHQGGVRAVTVIGQLQPDAGSWTEEYLGVSAFLIGLVLSSIGLLLLIRLILSWILIPSDKAVDRWLGKAVQRFVEQSREKLNLTKDVKDPNLDIYPIPWQIDNVHEDDITWRVGDDKLLRFSVYEFFILYISEHHIGVYIWDYNFFQDAAATTEMYEFQYKDVVSLSVQEITEEHNILTRKNRKNVIEKKRVTFEQLHISLINGQNFGPPTDISKAIDVKKNQKLPKTRTEDTINVIRALLRKKESLAS